jgi:hypothetical protein
MTVVTDEDVPAPEPFRPLSAREAGSSPRGPVEGVPGYMEQPLKIWYTSAAGLEDGLHQRVLLRLGETALKTSTMLDAVDALLYMLTPQKRGGDPDWNRRFPDDNVFETVTTSADVGRMIAKLGTLLADAGSVYEYRLYPGGLQRRVGLAEVQAAEEAERLARATTRPAAADDLDAAWRAVYGLHPNPSRAYQLAIRAVEHAAVPVVLPKAKLATLGTVRDHLREAAPKWRVELGRAGDAEVQYLVSAISLLWSGQVDRHGGQINFAEASQRQAQEAVQQAILLVRYFAGGFVVRRDESGTSTT